MEQYICNACGRKYEVMRSRWKCDCGGMLDLDKAAVTVRPETWTKFPNSMFRYADSMPFECSGTWQQVTMGEGLTPLLPLDGKTPDVYVKVDYMMPTLSFKDRGAAVLVAKARALGAAKVIADSSGNAGTSIASYSARAGIECDVYLSDTTSQKKMAQVKAHGANIREIPGSREAVAVAAQQAVADEGVFYASHVYNPYFYEGTKTYAYEIFEACGGAPDTLIIPAGNGTLLLGAYYGFKELLDSQLIDRLPRIIAVQAANVAPLALAFEKGDTEAAPVENKGTLAEGIAIAAPARSKQILEAVRETNGEFIMIEENDIHSARTALAEKGYYVEVTSAANYAAHLKYDRAPGEMVVIPLCGAGIKSD